MGAIASYGYMDSAARIRAGLPRVQRLSARTDWFRITDHTTGQGARLDLYDEIGFWGVSAGDFNAQLQAVSADRIAVHVNSPGGDVFDGIAILNLLRAHPAAIDVTVDGMAASAASFISMAGDTVTMMPNAEMMIHDALGVCIGNEADMQEMSALLGRVSDNIASVYATRTGTPVGDWRAAMRKESWYGAQEAVDAGLADSVAQLPAKQAQTQAQDSGWNLSFYAYCGRATAPAPAHPQPPPPQPVVAQLLTFDPADFRTAMTLEGAADQ